MTDTEQTTDPADGSTLTIRRNDEAHRYVALVGTDVAAYAEFRLRPSERIVFTHTVTEPAYARCGIAAQLVEWALTDARDRGETIVPRCPFMVSYLKMHHQFGTPWNAPSTAEPKRKPPVGQGGDPYRQRTNASSPSKQASPLLRRLEGVPAPARITPASTVVRRA